MKIYGLIGKSLSHSFSARYFREKFEAEGIDADYRLFELPDADRLPALIERTPHLAGLNVTVPFKKDVLPFMDSLHAVAADTGAVNCIKILRNNGEMRLHGFNTDAPAFMNSVQDFCTETPELTLVLGSGGSSAAVQYALRDMGWQCLVVSRKPGPDQVGYGRLTREFFRKRLLIVNCTPVGMHPDSDNFPPIPYKWLNASHCLYDLIYNPAETEFLRQGRGQGTRTMNGLEMLKTQAELSWKIWNGELFAE